MSMSSFNLNIDHSNILSINLRNPGRDNCRHNELSFGKAREKKELIYNAS